MADLPSNMTWHGSALFTKEDPKDQRGSVTCPRPHRDWVGLEWGCPGLPHLSLSSLASFLLPTALPTPFLEPGGLGGPPGLRCSSGPGEAPSSPPRPSLPGPLCRFMWGRESG